MKSVYCEIARGEGCTKISLYSEAEYKRELRRREQHEKIRRKRTHVREVAGALIGLAGFMMLVCAGGAYEVGTLIALGATGMGLMVLGGWMGHAFYGQEDKAEWMRRMRERGEIE